MYRLHFALFNLLNVFKGPDKIRDSDNGKVHFENKIFPIKGRVPPGDDERYRFFT